MTGTGPQPAGPKASRLGVHLTWRKSLLLALLFGVSGICLALWSSGLPISWTAEYDKERYLQIRRAIVADQEHLLGKSLDEVSKELSLQNVPWDDGSVQCPPGTTYRIYHFRGFALHVTVKLLPPGITPCDQGPWSASMADLQRNGVLWLAHQRPFVEIDGINDGKERMRQYWKAIKEECERINARMEQERKDKARR